MSSIVSIRTDPVKLKEYAVVILVSFVIILVYVQCCCSRFICKFTDRLPPRNVSRFENASMRDSTINIRLMINDVMSDTALISITTTAA